MPEIKHTFSAGKMNKDLDERLVPNGEYRDALNIRVSTSEGSDVGAVQNILGNTKLSLLIDFDGGKNNPYDTTKGRCVGAVADEKENCLYWFIVFPAITGSNPTPYRSFIVKYKEGVVQPVVIDMGGYNSTDHQPLGFHKLFKQQTILDIDSGVIDDFPIEENPIITGINVIDGLLFWTGVTTH